MSVRKFWWVLLLLLCSPILIVAQDDKGQVITPQNAAQIQQIDHIGGVEPGELRWSPDGRHLAMGSSEGVQIYDTGSAGDSRLQLPGGSDVVYNATGELLVSGNYLLNTATGATVAEFEPHLATYVNQAKDLLALISSDDNTTKIEVWNISSPASASLIATLDTESPLPLKQLQFSPDNSQLALALERYTPAGDVGAVAQLWAINSGELIFANTFPYDLVDAILFSGDGQYLIIGNRDSGMYGDPYGNVYVFSLDALVFEAMLEQSFYPVLSADGQWLAFATLYYETKLLQLGASLSELITLEAIDPNLTELPDFSSDASVLKIIEGGKLLAYQLLKVPVAPDLLSNINSFTMGSLPTYVFSPDGLVVAVSSGQFDDPRISIRDIQSGRLKGIIAGISPVAFSPDHRFLTVTDGESIQLWEVSTAQLVGTFARNATFNHDWSRVAYQGGSQVSVVDLLTNETTTLTVLSDFAGTPAGINLVAGQAVFVGTELQLRDLATDEITFSQPVSDSPPQVIFDGIGKRFAVMETRPGERFPIPFSVSIRSLDAPDVEISQIMVGEAAQAQVSFSSTGDYLVVKIRVMDSGEFKEKIAIYAAETGEAIFSKELPLLSNYTTSPDGNLLVITGLPELNSLQLDGLPDSELLNVLTLIASEWIIAMRFSADGQTLALNVFNGEASMMNAYNLYVLAVEELLASPTTINLDETTARPIYSVRNYALSPDSKTALIVEGDIYPDYPIQLVDLATQEVYASWSGIDPIAFNNAGTLAATAMLTANGSQVMIWDVSQLMNGNTTPMITLPESQKQPLEIKFSPDDTRFYIRDAAGISVWGLPD